MSSVKLAAIQFSPVWQRPTENIAIIEGLLASHQVDVIVLPEMFNTGFALNDSMAESMNGPTIQWMKNLAAERHAAITGSLKVSDGNKIFNRLCWVMPDGEVTYYDKRHLYGKEDTVISAGNQRVMVEFKGVRFLLQTCYDLRFPVFSRNCGDYDVMINVASWPVPRIHHWDALLTARAIENLSYVVGVNRTGSDENGWQFSGHSQIVGPAGEALARAGDNESEVISAEISLEQVEATRQALPYLSDADEFKLIL
ncbi:MAG: nitrilase-related carbon-nitrogen hydrolase [Kangiellaceae bacterium]|jgi:predicted amidohydrolase|nr:nitrilase-related carbon-nitrogen hydrolase [Kangiellaceae bacterium]